jgi:hypothetical protein
MTWIVEDPWPALVGGIVVEAILGVVLVMTGRGRLLWAMAGVLAATAGLVLLEWLVVTDVERVEDAIHGVAGAIQRNDVDEVLEYVSPSAVRLRTTIQSTIRRVHVRQISIKNNLQVLVNRRVNPPAAQASFSVVVTANGIQYPTFVVVRLRLEGERWRVYDYEDRGFQEGL